MEPIWRRIRVIAYTLYLLRDEHVIAAETFEAPDDVAATEAAQARRLDLASELWCGDRLVAFIAAADGR